MDSPAALQVGLYKEFGLGGCDCLWLFMSSCLLQGALTWCCWWLWLSFIVYVPPLHKFGAQWCFWLSFQWSPRLVFKVLEVTHCFLMLWFFKSSCSSGRFSVILNIFSLDYLLPTYTSFTNTLLTPLIFSAEVLANVEQHRSWEQQHNHLPHPHRHCGALHGSRRPEPNSATSSTCSDPSGCVQHFLPCFCPEIISSHNFAVVNNKHPESGWFCAGREALLADFHVSAFLPTSDPHLFADSQRGKS